MLEGSAGFRWLKNVGTVAPVLLHTPERIAALGVVMVLALMVRNYVQWTLRRRLRDTDSYVLDRLGKPSQNPTAETAFMHFAPIQAVHVFFGEQYLGRRVTCHPPRARGLDGAPNARRR